MILREEEQLLASLQDFMPFDLILVFELLFLVLFKTIAVNGMDETSW